MEEKSQAMPGFLHFGDIAIPRSLICPTRPVRLQQAHANTVEPLAAGFPVQQISMPTNNNNGTPARRQG
jgi:hypothetical protein